jgi:hypothetical protein
MPRAIILMWNSAKLSHRRRGRAIVGALIANTLLSRGWRRDRLLLHLLKHTQMILDDRHNLAGALRLACKRADGLGSMGDFKRPLSSTAAMCTGVVVREPARGTRARREDLRKQSVPDDRGFQR